MDVDVSNDQATANAQDTQNQSNKDLASAENIESLQNAKTDSEVFKSKWPNQMINIPTQRQSVRNRISKEALEAEKQIGGPAQTFQNQIADMTILTDSDTEQSSGYQQNSKSSLGLKPKINHSNTQKSKSVTFAQESPFDAILKERMIKEPDLLEILESIAGKGLSSEEKQSLIEKRLEDIEKKNIFKQSINVNYADMPKVFAFEVENNIRTVLAKILKPVMDNYSKVTENVGDLNECFGEVTRSIENVNRKLDKELQMNEKIDDLKQKHQQLRKDWEGQNEKVGRKISELNQLYNIHEDKLARYNDEKKLLTQSRDQMRADIREFEKLVQELANMGRLQVTDMQEDFSSQMSQLRTTFDQIMFDHRVSQAFIHDQKPKMSKLDAEIQMIKTQLQSQQTTIYRFENLEKIVAENEHFLGYILPLRIEESIYNSLSPIQDNDKELKLEFAEHFKDRMSSLKDKLDQVDKKISDLKTKTKHDNTAESEMILASFDKHKYRMPDFQKLIQSLKPNKDQDKRQSAQRQASDSEQSAKPSNSNQQSAKNSDSSDLSELSGTFGSKERKPSLPKRSQTKQSTNKVTDAVPQLNSLKKRLKLSHLKISNAQLLKFSSRVGRRLLKNQVFLDKLADCLDSVSASDSSEREEEEWGCDDGQADLRGYEDLYSDDQLESSSTEGDSVARTRPKQKKKKQLLSSKSYSSQSNSEESGESSQDEASSENDTEPAEPQSESDEDVSQNGESNADESIEQDSPQQQQHVDIEPESPQKTVKRVEFLETDHADDSKKKKDVKQISSKPDSKPVQIQNKAQQRTKQTKQPKKSKQVQQSVPKEEQDQSETEQMDISEDEIDVADAIEVQVKPIIHRSQDKKKTKDREKDKPKDEVKTKDKEKTKRQKKSKEKKTKQVQEPAQEQQPSIEVTSKSSRSKQKEKPEKKQAQDAGKSRSRRSRKNNEDSQKRQHSRSKPSEIDTSSKMKQEQDENLDIEVEEKPSKRRTPRKGREQRTEPKAKAQKERSRGRGRRHEKVRSDSNKEQVEPVQEQDVIEDPVVDVKKSERKSSRKQSDRNAQDGHKQKKEKQKRNEEKSHEKQRNSQKSNERSPIQRQDTRQSKGSSNPPKVVDVDAQFYQIRIFMEDIQSKIKRIEKAQASMRPHENKSKSTPKKPENVTSPRAQQQRQVQPRPQRQNRREQEQRNTVEARAESNQSKKSSESNKAEESEAKKESSRSQSSQKSESSSSSSSPQYGFELQITKLANEVKNLKQSFRNLNNQIENGRKGVTSAATDMLNQMTLKSSEMKQTLGIQKEQFDLIKEEMRQELKRLQRQDFVTSKGLDDLQSQLKNIKQKQQTIDHSQILQDNTFAIIFKLLRINYALLHQDELDKQNIFLVGANQTQGPAKNAEQTHGSSPKARQPARLSTEPTSVNQSPFRNQASSDQNAAKLNQSSIMGTELPKIQGQNKNNHTLLQFDKTCLSCGGPGQKAQQIPTLIKAFKMACLSYQPSQVVFDQKVYERNQLVEAQGYLLYLSLRQLQHLDFNAVDNILLGGQPEKVIYQEFLNQYTEAQNFDEFLQFANGLDKLNQSRLERNDMKGNHHVSAHIQPLNDHSMFAAESANHGSCDNSLFGGNSTEFQTASANPRVSLNKSKEFSVMASQIPHIIGIKDGQPVITSNDSSGIADPKDQEIMRIVKSVTKSSNQGYKAQTNTMYSRDAMKTVRKAPKNFNDDQSEYNEVSQSRNDHFNKQNQSNVQNYNTIQVAPPFASQTYSQSKPTNHQPNILSPDVNRSSSNRLGITTIGITRRSNMMKDQKLDSTMGSFNGSMKLDKNNVQGSQFGKNRLFSMDFGTSDIMHHKPKMNIPQHRAALGTAHGQKNFTGYHASLPKVQNTPRVGNGNGNEFFKAHNGARQSFENFGARKDHGYAFSGTSESANQIAALGAFPKTARTGFTQDSDQSNLQINTSRRFADTKPNFNQTTNQGSDSIQRSRQVTAPTGFDL